MSDTPANEQNPIYSPGHMDVCTRCVDRMVYEHDIEHRAVELDDGKGNECDRSGLSVHRAAVES